MIVPSPRSKKKARIEIVPLIDVIFFLLATFVMVSLSMIQNKGIPINLPMSSSSVLQHNEKQAIVIITEKGDIYFNKQQVSLALLQQEVNALKSNDWNPKVIIQGDVKTSLGDFTAVVDCIRKIGITKIAIQTKSTNNKTP